ncbi:MAG TPA: hypothetical protein VNO20_06330 [Solirubrobacterales bacterium]|nr:hypothetical protein [Solirubrobacterales bacterium]
MRSWPIASLALLGLAVLSGCGDDGTATAHKEATAQVEARTSTQQQGSPRCVAQVGAFVDSLDTLRRQLAVGLTYEEYIDEVRRLRRVYRDVPVDRLSVGCVLAPGAPGESAFNEYIDVANAWGDCLATAGCETASVEPELQRGWERASDRLSEAQAGLRS